MDSLRQLGTILIGAQLALANRESGNLVQVIERPERRYGWNDALVDIPLFLGAICFFSSIAHLNYQLRAIPPAERQDPVNRNIIDMSVGFVFMSAMVALTSAMIARD